MNTLQLKHIIENDKYAKIYFCGVIPIDYLPKEKLNNTCSFIVNTDDSTKIGQHWIAIFHPIFGNIEYFDPIGEKPSNKEIFEFINLNEKNYIYNSQRIQYVNSHNCGLFCIFYLILKSRGLEMTDILRFFNKQYTQLNDIFIENLFKKIKIKL